MEEQVFGEIYELGICSEDALLNHYHESDDKSLIRQSINNLVINDRVNRECSQYGTLLWAKNRESMYEKL